MNQEYRVLGRFVRFSRETIGLIDLSIALVSNWINKVFGYLASKLITSVGPLKHSFDSIGDSKDN